MTNAEYTAAVDAGNYPDDPKVPLDAPVVNGAGPIQNLVLGMRFASAAIIESRLDSVRANHYHKTDWHYIYVLEGILDYRWRKLGESDVKQRNFYPGDMIFTPPLVEHVVLTPCGAKFVTLAKNSRDHASHEADVVRVQLLDPLERK